MKNKQMILSINGVRSAIKINSAVRVYFAWRKQGEKKARVGWEEFSGNNIINDIKQFMNAEKSYSIIKTI